jgi:hypothetical protein
MKPKEELGRLVAELRDAARAEGVAELLLDMLGS